MKKVLVVIAILVAAAACGGAGSSASSGGVSLAPATKAGPAQSGGSSTGAPTTINGQPGDTTNPTGAGTIVPVLQGPPVIRQAELSISVGAGTFDSKLSAARTLVEADGGYIAGTSAQAAPVDSQIRTGVINFMVPAANFDTTIDQLSKIGKVQNEQITGTDVSGQYLDLQTRLDNAEAQRTAMLALLTQAKNINDMIAVQNQIAQITGTIEQLKGQIKYLDAHTAFSALTITMTEAPATAPTPVSDNWGLSTALSDAAHNFVATINYVVVGLGVLGPFILLGGVGYLLWRRRSKWLPRHA
jgi:hypothetical protein